MNFLPWKVFRLLFLLKWSVKSHMLILIFFTNGPILYGGLQGCKHSVKTMTLLEQSGKVSIWSITHGSIHVSCPLFMKNNERRLLTLCSGEWRRVLSFSFAKKKNVCIQGKYHRLLFLLFLKGGVFLTSDVCVSYNRCLESNQLFASCREEGRASAGQGVTSRGHVFKETFHKESVYPSSPLYSQDLYKHVVVVSISSLFP